MNCDCKENAFKAAFKLGALCSEFSEEDLKSAYVNWCECATSSSVLDCLAGGDDENAMDAEGEVDDDDIEQEELDSRESDKGAEQSCSAADVQCEETLKLLRAREEFEKRDPDASIPEVPDHELRREGQRARTSRITKVEPTVRDKLMGNLMDLCSKEEVEEKAQDSKTTKKVKAVGTTLWQVLEAADVNLNLRAVLPALWHFLVWLRTGPNGCDGQVIKNHAA